MPPASKTTGSILGLLDPSPGPRWACPETAALALWCLTAAYAVHIHVPWADESQAWLLASENSWPTLFFHLLHFEGTGGLWHAFLKLFAMAHLSFAAARYAAAALEAAGMAVLLRYSPFPRVLRLLLPFSFFLFFQDAAIARSYCLFAVLAFPAAAVLRGKRQRPKTLALLTGLLANLSVHGVVLGAGVLAAAVLQRQALTEESDAQVKSAHATPLGTLPIPKTGKLSAIGNLSPLFWAAPLFLFAGFTLAPAPDIDFQAGGNLHNSLAKAVRPFGIHLPITQSVAALPYAGLKPAPVPVHTRRGGDGFLNRAGRILGVLTFPLSRFRVLALALVAALLAQAQRKAGLLPWLLMAAVFSSLYLAPRHTGTLFTGFLVSAWITWPTRPSALGRLTAALFLLVTIEQIGWTAHALQAERTGPYSPARMTARFLQAQGVGQSQTAAGYLYFSSAPLLYFPRNIYINQPPHRFWLWSTRVRGYQSVEETLARQPRFVVVSTVQPGPDAEVTRDWLPTPPRVPGVRRGDQFGFIGFFEAHGYRETRLFCGRSLMRASYAEQLCDTILERKR